MNASPLRTGKKPIAAFAGRTILVLGCGAIAKTLIPLLLRHIAMPDNALYVLDEHPATAKFAASQGTRFSAMKLSAENHRRVLDEILQPRDLLISLTTGVDTLELMKYCDMRGIYYLDTSSEGWPPHPGNPSMNTFARRERLLAAAKAFVGGSTLVASHGANPGLVSHFLKRALERLASAEGIVRTTSRTPRADWSMLTRRLRVHDIHISERDTQEVRNDAGLPNLLGTWSVSGFLEECNEKCCYALGSHEEQPPGSLLTGVGCRAIETEEVAWHKETRSWTPSCGPFSGFLVPHSETFTIAQLLAKDLGTSEAYQPTVLFCYQPSRVAIQSLQAAAALDRSGQARIVTDEIVDGFDEVGVNVFYHGNERGLWCGSRLHIAEVRSLNSFGNATTLQVAAGALAGIGWLLNNPHEGFCEPEDVDHSYVLDVATPYLGNLFEAAFKPERLALQPPVSAVQRENGNVRRHGVATPGSP